jgi:hypothetical protein
MKTNRIYGVEIECSDGNRNPPRGWEFRYEHCGYEFVSPLLNGSKGLDEIRYLYGCVEPEVDRNCGLHVHVDVRDFDDNEKLELVKRLQKDKHLFTSKVDPFRLTNSFCNTELPLISYRDTFYSYTCKLQGDRFCWVNLLSVYKHGSIEFRLHEATEDVEKVCDWVEFLVTYVENVKTGITVTECPADVDKTHIYNCIDMLVS